MKAKKPAKQFNGPALLAAMFRELDPQFRKKLHEKLQKISPIIAKLVDDFAFVYSDLIRLDDAGLQTVLRHFPEKDWLVVWKLTDEDLRRRLLANMSANKRDDFQAQAAKQPRILKKQVLRMQMHIAAATRQMLEDGKLRITSRRPKLTRRRLRRLKSTA